MRTPRLYVESALTAAELDLPEGPARHIAQVLRMRVGDAVTLFNGDGRDYAAELIDVGKRAARVRIGAAIEVDNESPLHITLLQGVSKGERMDWVMQKSVELGVHAIVPVITERTVVRVDDARSERKRAHWQAVVVGACEQSGRARLPAVHVPLKFADAIANWRGIVLDPTASAPPSAPPDHETALLIGPEGGLSDAEIAAALAAGWQGARLGPRVLRTETAALAALTALQARWGDLA